MLASVSWVAGLFFIQGKYVFPRLGWINTQVYIRPRQLVLVPVLRDLAHWSAASRISDALMRVYGIGIFIGSVSGLFSSHQAAFKQ